MKIPEGPDVSRLSFQDGENAIRFARHAIEEWVKNNRTLQEKPHQQFFNERRGVLLSMFRNDSKLHGRIGYPYPMKSLADVLVRCAVSVCQDPRSPALKASDINNVTLEVSILSEPGLLAKPFGKNFDPIKDGLVVVRGPKRAMIMPGDVMTNSNDAIAEAIKKAGIEKHLVYDGLTKLYKFGAQTFFETEPNGKVVEKDYGKKPTKKTTKAKKARNRRNGKSKKEI